MSFSKVFSVFIILIFQIILFVSCSEDNNTNEQTFRFIYYPVGSQDGAEPGQMGLYRMSTLDSVFTRENLSKYSIIYTSGIATNGVIVFENNTSTIRLEAICEAGTKIDVPFPKHQDTSREYVLITPPRMNISFNGHRGAYFVWDKKKGSEEPEDKILNFVTVSCVDGSIITKTFSQFIENNFANTQINSATPFGEYLFLNTQGDKIWFVLKLFNFQDGIETNIKYAIVEYYNKDFILRSAVKDEPIELRGYNSYSRHLITVVGDTVKTLDENNEFYNNKLKLENLSNPNQFSVARAEVVVWADEGLELLNPSTGAFLKSIIKYSMIDPTGQMLIQSNPRLSISPDGSYIVFALSYKDNPNVYSLFIVDRDGKNVKKLTEMPMGIPKISNELKE